MIGKFLQQPEGYRAFMPAKFPQDLGFKPTTKIILANDAATLAVGKLDGLAQLVPDIDFFTLMYKAKEATLSSNIEGTKATMHDYLKAQADIARDVPKDVTDIVNYLKALKYGLKNLDRLPLASRLVLEMHARLLSEPGDSRHTPGEFRRSQNWIGGTRPETADYVPPPHTELSRCLKDFDNFINESSLPYPPLIKIGLAHAQFETIHPFLDGNGRLGRLLITLQLCHDGLLDRPSFYISEYLKRHRQVYFQKLTEYRQGRVDGWLEFFLEGVQEVSESASSTAKKLVRLRESNYGQVHSLGRQAPSALKLLRGLYHQPVVVGATQVAEITGLTRQAAYGLLRRFVDLGILHRVDETKKQAGELIHRDYVHIFQD